MLRELNSRESDGLSVAILWNSDTDEVFVSVLDSKTATAETFQIDPADATDAFAHPFTYTVSTLDDLI